jgi:hypothetical protein
MIGGTNGIPAGRYRVRAASCNVFGCSAYGPPTESAPAPPGPPSIKAELPPFLMDVRGLILPRKGPLPDDPFGADPSVTIPPPENPGG